MENEKSVTGQPIGMALAMSVIDEALQAGVDRRLLRWRVSPAQRTGMYQWSYSICINPSKPTTEVETGKAYEAGEFCGIPLFVDHALPKDCIVLEQMAPTPITRISGLAVPSWY